MWAVMGSPWDAVGEMTASRNICATQIAAAWEASGRAFDRALDDFTDAELAVVERYLDRTTEVGGEQTARLRRG